MKHTRVSNLKVEMNILIYSHAFAPQIGGVETYAMHLARGSGHA